MLALSSSHAGAGDQTSGTPVCVKDTLPAELSFLQSYLCIPDWILPPYNTVHNLKSESGSTLLSYHCINSLQLYFGF